MGTTARVNGASPRELLAMFGSASRPRRGPEGERPWLGRADWCGVQLWLPHAPARVVICPKTAPVGWWLTAGGVPADFGFACTAHPSDERALRLLQQALPRSCPLVFVGDLDPLAPVQYLQLARKLARGKRRIFYGGIDDAWLRAMRRGWARANGVEVVRIPLSPGERRLLAALEGTIDLDRLVGTESAALLRDGHKVEIEAATNPVFYRKGYVRWAFRHLREVGARQSK